MRFRVSHEKQGHRCSEAGPESRRAGTQDDRMKKWSHPGESNPEPPHYECGALPIELGWPSRVPLLPSSKCNGPRLVVQLSGQLVPDSQQW